MSGVLILGMFLFCDVQADAAIKISKGNIQFFKIAIYDDENVIQKKAAEELQYFLNKVFSKKIEIVNKTAINGENHFLIGLGFVNDSLFSIDAISQFSLVQSIYEGNIYLGGHDKNIRSIRKTFIQDADNAHFGSLYAVYNFLEREVGIHWFFPTYLGEFIPKINFITLNEETTVEKPDFVERDFGLRFLHNNDDTAMAWLIRNKAGVPNNKKRYNHNWRKIIPPVKYYDSLPEIFALINGSRVSRVKGKYAPLCTTNGQLCELFIEQSLSYLRKHPKLSYLSISPNDGRLNCECENCSSADTCDHLDEFDKHSCLIFSFYKKISDSIWQYYPEVEIGGFAYKGYSRAVKEITLADKFHIRLAVNNYGFNNDKCQSYSDLSSIISSWKEKENKGFFSFPYGNVWAYPFLQTELYQKLILELKENHFQEAVFFMLPDWYNQGMDIWIMTKLLWNTDLDLDSLKTVYYNSVFPESYKAIQFFHQELQNKIQSVEFCVEKFSLPNNNRKRNMFLNIYSEDLLETTLEKIEFQLNKSNKLLLKEKQNLLNFKTLITFLLIERDGFYWYNILKIRPGEKEAERYNSIVNQLQLSVGLSSRSKYFDSHASPSLFMKQYLIKTNEKVKNPQTKDSFKNTKN